ncbi:recombinase family protein [Amycolatopsis anabasis]|uniref:recombinase family protein n=1 Tax=Amycolatopsis anabasis TaxID=1840409 RepID=UPI00131DB124|nr:recombinase family protein [Amycolatopsis anabasis]
MRKTVLPPPLAIIYLRLSDLRLEDLDEKGDGKTFGDREKKLREFADRLGWPVLKVVIENDVDRKTGKPRPASAFKRRRVTLPNGSIAMRVWRPGFRSILDDFTHGRATALLAEDLDRVTRDPRDLEDLIDVAEAKKINARSLTGSLTLTDGGTSNEITIARFMVTSGNKASRDTAQRVADARERQAVNGLFGGGVRRFGFEPDGITHRPTETEVIAEYSERVVQLAASTDDELSLRMLAAELREQGVLTATGKPMRAAILREYLLRPRNAGIMVFRGEEIGKAPWEPIVDLDTFRAVERVLTDPARKTSPGPTPRWLGSGLYVCGVCENPSLRVGRNGGHGTPSYVCFTSRHLARNALLLDQFVQDTLLARVSQPGFVEQFIPRRVGSEVDVATLQAEAHKIRINLNGLAEDRAMGVIDRAQMIKGTQRGKDRLGEIRQLLADAASDSPLRPFIGADDVRAVWQLQPLATKRAVLDTLAKVAVHRTRPGAKRLDPDAIDIAWKQPRDLHTSA